MVLHPDFRDFVASLLSHRVRFVVVGAHALAAHGRPRLTGDLDVLVEPTPPNARRVIAALSAFGFGHVGLAPTDFARPDHVVQLGNPPVRIDLLTSIAGVGFSTAWKNRLVVELDGMRVPMLGRRDLIRNKKAAGRPKDLLDIELLREGSSSRRRRP
jgi:hypothetical protein